MRRICVHFAEIETCNLNSDPSFSRKWQEKFCKKISCEENFRKPTLFLTIWINWLDRKIWIPLKHIFQSFSSSNWRGFLQKLRLEGRQNLLGRICKKISRKKLAQSAEIKDCKIAPLRFFYPLTPAARSKGNRPWLENLWLKSKGELGRRRRPYCQKKSREDYVYALF